MSDTTHPLVYIILVVMFCVAIISTAFAQDISHHPQAMHEKFYSTWQMPDDRTHSCCHNDDCSPAESYLKDGRWYARHVGDDGDFEIIPTTKIEEERDSPDGRSHLCGKRYPGGFSVYCFLPAGGS